MAAMPLPDAARVAALLLAALSLAPGAAAQVTGSLTRAGSGARAAGMGNAYIAVADDGTAATWNPAGLAQLRKPELSLVLNKVVADTTLEGFRSPDGRYTWTRRHDAASYDSPEFASIAIPFDLGRPTTLQFGWRRLYLIDDRLDVETRREPTGLAAGEPPLDLAQFDDAQGSVDVLSIAGAMRVTDRLSLGLSWDLWRGGWDIRQSRRQALQGESVRLAEALERNDVDGDNLNVGLMLHYPRWRVGFVYHSPVMGSLQESGRTFGLVEGEAQAEGPTRGAMRFPTSVGAGVSWRPLPHWTLAGDATWDEWRRWLVDIPGRGRVNLFDGRPPSESSTRNTVSFNLGSEWILRRTGHFVPLRMGFSWEPQGPRDAVLFTGYSLRLVSVGAGYNSNRFKFDAAVQYGWFEQQVTEPMQLETLLRREQDRYAYDAIGRRSEHTWRIKISAILRITDTARLRRTLGRIFGGGEGPEDP